MFVAVKECHISFFPRQRNEAKWISSVKLLLKWQDVAELTGSVGKVQRYLKTQ